jgi:hypothetical protein
VFTARDGGPIRHRNFYRPHFRPAVANARELAIKEDRKDDAIPEALRFHDLRDSCAAILIANGQHVEEVKRRLGHSSIRVTSDRYGHLFPSARQALVDGLDATFQEAAVPPQTDEGRTKSRIAPSTADPDCIEMAFEQALLLERTTGFEPATLTLAR